MKDNKKVNKKAASKLNCTGSRILVGLAVLIAVLFLIGCFYHGVGNMGDGNDSNADPNWKEPPTEQTPPPSQPTQKEWVNAPAGYWGKPVPENAIWIP